MKATHKIYPMVQILKVAGVLLFLQSTGIAETVVLSGGGYLPQRALKKLGQGLTDPDDFILVIDAEDEGALSRFEDLQHDFAKAGISESQVKRWDKDLLSKTAQAAEKDNRLLSIFNLQVMRSKLAQAKGLFIAEGVAKLPGNPLSNPEFRAMLTSIIDKGTPVLVEGVAADLLAMPGFRGASDGMAHQDLEHEKPDPVLPDLTVVTGFPMEKTDLFNLVNHVLQGKAKSGVGVPSRSSVVLEGGKMSTFGVQPGKEFSSFFVRRLSDQAGVIVHVQDHREDLPLGHFDLGVKCLPAPAQIDPNISLVAAGRKMQGTDWNPVRRWTNPSRDKVLVVTWANDAPDSTYNTYARELEQIGFKRVNVMRAPDLDEMLNRKGYDTFLGQLREPTLKGIIFGGGSQNRVFDYLNKYSAVRDEILEKVKQGQLFYGGGSAGTAAISEFRFTGYDPDDGEVRLGTDVTGGFNLIPGVVVDTHFSQRSRRLMRLMGSLTKENTRRVSDAHTGIGIGEKGSIVVKDGRIWAAGEEPTYIVNRIDERTFRVRAVKPGEEIKLEVCAIVSDRREGQRSSPLQTPKTVPGHGASIAPQQGFSSRR